MSKFYGQVQGMAQTVASRRGSSFIKSSVQSWDGSLITRMFYDGNGKLIVQIDVDKNTSTFYGQGLFYGTLDELVEKLTKD